MYELCETLGGRLILLLIAVFAVVLICVADIIEDTREKDAKEYRPRGGKTDARAQDHDTDSSGN